MRAFAKLCAALEGTTSTRGKLRALVDYFRAAPAPDAAWAAYFLTGHRLARVVRTADLREAAMIAAIVPPWLFDACRATVGDFAEAIALVLPPPADIDRASLAAWIEHRILPLAQLDAASVQRELIASWSVLERDARFVVVKVLMGTLRIAAGRELVHRGLADVAGVTVADVAQRLSGSWHPSVTFWDQLRGSHVAHALHRPHPFCPAYPLDGSPETLGEREAWQAEWKWDGVRVQLIVRDGAITLWSRGEELVSDRFPEIAAAAHRLAPGTVLDGEVVAWRAGEAHPAPFALLRRRLAPRAPAGTTLRAVPVRMIAYDILESAGADLRGQPLHARRRELERVVGAMDSAHVCVSPVLQHPTWRALSEARSHAREQNVEGIMLKAIDDAYAAGHTGCRWWKWQSEPHHIDAVLLYARPGSGRRAGVLADYTFGVWHEESLVPFAAASSGLADDEIREIDAWIRGHTIDRFGPVRHVEPVQVFELAFAAIELSQRHKSGVAVRLPRIARWRRDKRAHDAGTLDTLRALAGGSAQ